jgi:hypothetical protein
MAKGPAAGAGGQTSGGSICPPTPAAPELAAPAEPELPPEPELPVEPELPLPPGPELMLPLEPELPLLLEAVLPPAAELAPALPAPALEPFPGREEQPVAAANATARAVPITAETRRFILMALIVRGAKPDFRAASFQGIRTCCREPQILVTQISISRRKRQARDLARHA